MSTSPYDGFFPGRKWEPLQAGMLEKGDTRRKQQQRRRKKWARQQLGSAGVAVVCLGNIARSQVFAHFLDAKARASLLPLRVSSCGVAAEENFPHWRRLLDETEKQLAARTPPGVSPPQLTRNWWGPATVELLLNSTIILAADSSIRDTVRSNSHTIICASHSDGYWRQLVRRLSRPVVAVGAPPVPPPVPPIALFYEFAGEGGKDFADTYAFDRKCQDETRYNACFHELERMSIQAIDSVDQQLLLIEEAEKNETKCETQGILIGHRTPVERALLQASCIAGT